MPDTKRQQLVSAIIARMVTIRISNGYETDLGLLVEDWPRRYQADELPALSVCDLTSEDEQDDPEAAHTIHRMPVQLRIHVKDGTPAALLRKMMADVEKAISVDRLWGYLALSTKPKRSGLIVPNDNNEVAGAAVEVEVAYITQTFNAYQ
jgi:hypothetical protein